MKKLFSAKRLLLFSAAALSTYGIILACAGGWWGYDFNSNFTPEAFVTDASYAPLFFAPDELFYPAGHTQNISRFNKNIVDDWAGYLSGKLPYVKTVYFLLDTNSTASINEIHKYIKTKQPLPAIYNYYVKPSEPKVASFFEFMHYAKLIEASSTNVYWGWDHDKTKIRLVDNRTIQAVESLYASTTDPFLKNRYWFQAMKAHFYSANRQNVIAFFEKTKTSTPNNTLYYRALAYVAGAYYANKNYTMSNYLYALVFDKIPELRCLTAYNFHPQEQADFENSLLLAKNNQEKAALWAVFGYYADEKKAIKEIYRLLPTSPHLDYLLTRLINKEETRLNEYRFASAADFQQAMKNQVNAEALQLVNTIASEGKTGKSFLWNTAAGYLNIFAGEYSTAEKKFELAAQGTNDTLAVAQLRILKLINSICSVKLINRQTEEEWLPELSWLYGKPQVSEDFRYQNAILWSKRYISSLYKSQGNKIMGELFFQGNDFYHEDSNAEAIKSFMAKPNKSIMEIFANANYPLTLSDINEYQSVMSALVGKIDESIAFMQKSDERITQLLGNPFNGNIKDCHDCDHEAYKGMPFTKLSFLLKIKEMRTHVDKGEDVYNNSLLLGNAFYSMSYFGNARAFYQGKITNQYGNYIEPYYQPYLLDCSLAKQYYQRAFDAALSSEQKAKCQYMLAKCERNEFYAKTYHSERGFYGDVPIAFKEWAGFKKLRDDYKNTKYFQEVIEECGYFEKYITK